MKNAERRMKCVLRRKHSTFYILHSAFAKRVACRMRSTKETTEGQTMNLPLCSCQGAQAPPQRREAERAEELRKSFQRRGSRNANEAERNEEAHPRKGRTAGQAASPAHTISFTISGGNDEGVPPVPIPNTEVKPFSAESTWLDTAREHRSPPDSLIPQ